VKDWLAVGEWLERTFGPGGLALCFLSAVLGLISYRLWNRLLEVYDARLKEQDGTLKALHDASTAQRELAGAIEKVGSQVESLKWEMRR
jgi:hypothetical protein